MPVLIGTTQHTFADPIGLLSDCHRRIEMFLGTLAKLAARAGERLEDQAAMEAALRYFEVAAPKHTADEEEDLFPMLRRREARDTVETLDRLEDQHATAEAWHREVDVLARRWLDGGRLSSEDAARLQDLLKRLTDLYAGHIEAEETRLFPLAQKVLSREEKEALGRHMASRRGVPYAGRA